MSQTRILFQSSTYLSDKGVLDLSTVYYVVSRHKPQVRNVPFLYVVTLIIQVSLEFQVL